MTVGLQDKDIQGEVLAKGNQLQTFDAKLDLILALEDGRRAREQLDGDSPNATIAAQQSGHRRRRNRKPDNAQVPQASPPPNAPPGCFGCGSKDHGKGTGKPRKLHCPAYNSKCEHCGILGHVQSVCRRKKDTTLQNNKADVNKWLSLFI